MLPSIALNTTLTRLKTTLFANSASTLTPYRPDYLTTNFANRPANAFGKKIGGVFIIENHEDHVENTKTILQDIEDKLNEYKDEAVRLSHLHEIAYEIHQQFLVGDLTRNTRNAVFNELNRRIQELNELIALAEFINQKTLLDPAIKRTKAQLEKCRKTEAQTFELARRLPGSKQLINRALSNDNFKIYCSTQQQIKASFGSQADAIFHGQGQVFYISDSPKVDPVLLHHEFIHADTFFRHQSQRCKADSIESAITPVFPATVENIRDYNQALALGDKRINHFAELRAKKKRGLKLSSIDSGLLDSYTQASKNCLSSVIVTPISPHTYQQLTQAGWKQGSQDFTFALPIDNDKELVEVIQELPIQGSKRLLAVKPRDPAYAVSIIPRVVTSALNQPTYKNKSEKIKLAEREAYTFQTLSEQAIQTFYEEAYTLRNYYFNLCTEDTASLSNPAMTP
ncbi:MAG: hypothetical protein K0S11_994 [Gammaproteobacteria bacterium]|nr:hypothetical protein [Gammaproteobacteria bacterium]